MTDPYKPPYRRTLLGAVLLAASAFGAVSAQAQTAWPTKQVRIVVGFAPGGTTDGMARLMAQSLTEALGQTVIVDNKPGASGNIGAGEVVKATDGHTLLLAPTSVETANPSLFRTGKVKLLGVASAKRSPFFPDAPTLGEQGIKGSELDIWFGIWAPVGTPPDVLARLNRELSKALATANIKQRFGDFAAKPMPLDAAAFRKLLDDEAKVLTALIKDRKITVD